MYYVDKNTKDYLRSVDNNAILHFMLRDEIIEGNLRTEGCKRIKNEYIIEMPKYKCTIKRFDIQELMGYSRILNHKSTYIKGNRRGGHSLPDFKFFTLDSVVEYTFEILRKDEYYPFLLESLNKKFYDVSISDNKIIIKYHFYDNSINQSKHEYLDNFYNYDFTVNIFHKNDSDNIINIVKKMEIIYIDINNQIEVKDIYGNKN